MWLINNYLKNNFTLAEADQIGEMLKFDEWIKWKKSYALNCGLYVTSFLMDTQIHTHVSIGKDNFLIQTPGQDA